ncbi:MAG: Translation elongation factor-like protein [Candidatus Gottesmanbacteria bacterium GW2011_GWA1_47_8]|uniref:Translation elongation factor-like protein n=1 Tax=Candidatus Gottesmanbacteria bacterium GW2011_GWA1_47_8 TaxID=1618438 RepID=A0A0G1VSQ4_9BACT|nr:MAG: Translation elongation factor-like protein [Candidatus Gottesmanbacteria bacterium GW2011_GWA1_47_8]
MSMDVQIGKITHFYDKIGVAVVEVTNQSLRVGNKIKISGHDNEFNQIIESLQVEHAQVSEVKPGESCGVKVNESVKAGDVLFLVTK